MAQDQNAAGSGSQAQAPAKNFSDEQLQQFADASQNIAMISQDYTEQLQNASDEGEQQKIRQQANDEMVQAVKDSGMSVEQFNSIGQAIQQDPQLMQRVKGMVQQPQQ
jgi:GTP1/Obg family GTP-binding protein